MWPNNFEQRLLSWNNLRKQVALLPLDQCLNEINNWWMNTPWTAYHLHWDDRQTWPDPWQLLSDNIYCPLARGLGIMYTITLINRDDCQDACLAELNDNNLVLIDNEKYLLNWDIDTIVNNIPETQKNKNHVVIQDELKKQYNL